MRMKFVTLLTLCLAAAMPAARAQNTAPAPAGPRQALDTGCGERDFLDGYYMEDGRRTYDVERYAAEALRLSTPVYQDSSGDVQAARALRFGERVRVTDPGLGTDRIKVNDLSAQPIGWVARSTVLCRIFPLSSRANPGWHDRLLIRSGVRKLYQTPENLAEEQRCEGSCAGVREHQIYFIYAEENDHYLISQDANLASNSSQLAGWVHKSDGQIWNTGIGLRPREELADVSPGTLEKFACAYVSMDRLKSGKNDDCYPILGGKRWLGLTVRMLVLQETPTAYQILFQEPGPRPSDVARDVVVDGITKAFVPADDKVVLEALLSRDQLNGWLRFLYMFKEPPSDWSNQTWRRNLLRQPIVMFYDFVVPEDARLGDYDRLKAVLQLKGAHSRLLKYSSEELVDSGKVPDCEIDRIKQYLAARYDMLNIIFGTDGRARPFFTETAWPESQCPNASDKGKNLPFIGEIGAQALNSPGQATNYSTMHRRGSEQFFWVPLDYLP